MEKKRKSTTLRLTEQDIQAILKIRQITGIPSDNGAIVFAVRWAAQQLENAVRRASARIHLLAKAGSPLRGFL